MVQPSQTCLLSHVMENGVNEPKRKGKIMWTAKEEKRIGKNVRRFLRRTPEVENFDEFVRGNDAENKRLKKKSRFTEYMLYKLPGRVFNSVRCKLLSMYCPNYKSGKWTREEVNRLFQLYEMMPNKWRVISDELNRKPLNCYNKYHAAAQQLSTEGCYEWLPKELHRLRKYVAKYTGTKLGTPVEKGIPFGEVARKLGSKLEYECRGVWLLTDVHETDEFKPYVLEAHEFMRILEFLARMDYSSYASIDFEHIRDEILGGRIPFVAAISYSLRERCGMTTKGDDRKWRDVVQSLLQKHGMENLMN